METENKGLQAVYTIVKKSDGKDLWLRIGSAFPNRDGSLSVFLDATPTNGKLQIREYQPRDSVAPRTREPRESRVEAEVRS